MTLATLSSNWNYPAARCSRRQPREFGFEVIDAWRADFVSSVVSVNSNVSRCDDLARISHLGLVETTPTSLSLLCAPLHAVSSTHSWD